MGLELAMEFIDLCIDNYENGGHSTTKEQEHRYYELKHQFQDDLEKAKKWDELALDKEDKDIALHGARIIKQNQKLRELIEKAIKENEPYKTDPDSGGLYYELQKLSKDSKK